VVRPPLYGLDIVTRGSLGGPRPGGDGGGDSFTDPVLAAGLSLDGRDLRFEGAEGHLLEDLDEVLADLRPGVLVSWQGGVVDLPVLAARAHHLEVAIGLRLRRDPRDRRRSPLTGATGGYCGSWYRHRHLDLARVYDSGPGLLRLLRPRNDEDLIPPADDRAWHDPCRDAHLARCLAARRWSRARRLVDRMPPPSGPALPPDLTGEHRHTA
jgi:hypothetical protein